MSPQSQIPRSEYADHFASIPDAVAAIGRGEIVVVVDDCLLYTSPSPRD